MSEGSTTQRSIESANPAGAEAVQPRRPDPAVHVMLGVLCLLVLIAAFVLQVQADVYVCVPWLGPLPETCWFRWITSWECPGCGLTRSFVSLAHGDVPRAFAFNPAGPLLFVLLAAQLPYRAWQYWRLKTGRPEFRFATRWEWLPLFVVFAVLFAQWVVKLLGVVL